MSSLKSLYASFEENEELLNGEEVTEAELDEAESSVEEAGDEVEQSEDDEETLEQVTTGLEALLSDIEAVSKAQGSMTVANLRMANTAYRGYMSHLTANPGHIVSSFEELTEVNVEAAEDANEKETTAEVDVTEAVTVEVSIEAMDGIKSKLASAGRATKEMAIKAWEKLMAFFKKVLAFFDFAGKRAAKLKGIVSGLKDADRKAGEFVVPNAASLAFKGSVKISDILKGATNLHDTTKLVYANIKDFGKSLIQAYNASKANDDETQPALLAEVEKIYAVLVASVDKGVSGGRTFSASGGFTGPKGGKFEALKEAPTVSELKSLLEMAGHLSGLKKELKDHSDLMAQGVKEGDPENKSRIMRGMLKLFSKLPVSRFTSATVKVSSQLLKVTEAGIKAYGVAAPTEAAPTLALDSK